ncbi:MAG: Maf family protein [Planctomycetales bacterium]
MLPQTQYILASSSPRRRQLMAAAGYRFEVVAPRIDDAALGLCSNCGPAELVTRLARLKAADVIDQLSGAHLKADLVIACDTVVECGGQILGKPTGDDHAREMLELLSASCHRVYSGLCLWRLPAGPSETRFAATTLQMDKLSARQIHEYVQSNQWEGKAGGFGYQDGHDWLQIVEGSESNVVGLPMELLSEMLADGI